MDEDNALVRRLLQFGLDKELPGPNWFDAPPPPTDAEIAKLLGLASRLSFGESQDRALAFEVSARVLNTIDVKTAPGVVSAADFILARIGNFPGRLAMSRRHQRTVHHPILAELEIAGHERFNTVQVGKSKPVTLTDDQRRVVETLARNNFLSFSAPTSAGKTFVLTLDIARRLLEKPQTIVYVVPTRALIRQVIVDLAARFREAGVVVPIRGAPVLVSPRHATRGVAYVLTQERLMGLMQLAEAPKVGCLIIDEAHNIFRDARGVLLEDAVQQVAASNPDVALIFGMPPVGDPRFFNSKFGGKDGPSLPLRGSPVFQNKIHVSRHATEKDLVEFRLVHRTLPPVVLQRRIKPPRTKTDKDVRAWFAHAITRPGETTIIYVAKPHDASLVAGELARLVPAPSAPPKELHDLAEYLKNHVHPDYDLVRFVEKGITVHHGSVPSAVRARIETLAEAGLFRYIVCTNTLLAGVNLPAKHIVIHKPQVGRKPITAADFKNLAGRAGRLRWDFYGNVWLLESGSWWTAELDTDEDTVLESSYDAALRTKIPILEAAVAGQATKGLETLADAVLSKAFIDVVANKKSLAKVAGLPPPSLELFQRALAALRLDVPLDVVRRNVGLSPLRVNLLFQRLSKESDLSPWILGPIPKTEPEVKPFEEQLGRVLELTRETLEADPHDSPARRLIVTSQWLRNKPLKLIIQGYLTWAARRGIEKKTAALINDAIDYVEDVVRFQVVRDLRVFEDIMTHLLGVRGAPQKMAPWHLYVECGTSDDMVLKLVGLGLSRIAALEVRKTVVFNKDLEPEDYLDQLREAAERPGLWDEDVRAEVKQLLGFDVQK